MQRIALAAVASAHGVKGEVRLKLFSDSVDSLARHEKLYVAGIERRLLDVRDSGKTAVARFEGIADRSAAEALRGSLVEIDRTALPPLTEGEYYHADLIRDRGEGNHRTKIRWWRGIRRRRQLPLHHSLCGEWFPSPQASLAGRNCRSRRLLRLRA